MVIRNRNAAHGKSLEDQSMKNSMLRAPLIKSAVLLAVFSLIIYLTISSPEGSVWSSLQAIFYTVFKAAQLGVGLILALALCFAVLGGIFFACVAMVSTDSARKMFHNLRQFASDKTESITSMIGEGRPQWAKGISGELAASLRNDMAELHASMKNLGQAQRLIEEGNTALRTRVEQVEQDETVSRLSDWLRAEEEKTQGVQEALEQLTRQMQQMREQVDGMEQKIENVLPEDALQEITGRTDILENRNRDLLSAVQTLQKKVDALEAELQAVRTGPAAGEGQQAAGVSEQENSTAHRLFTYIESSGEKAKVQQLVADTLDEEMTYAQVTEYVSGKVDKKTARVLADHPSLTKEYIREARKGK
jgi:archaellum component FlaC